MVQWQSLQNRLRETLSHPANQRLAQSIFATAAPEAIGALLNAFCRAELGGAITACRFSYLRVGGTFIVQLTTGQTCVIKAYGLDQDESSVQACLTSQDWLARSGFPCPSVLAGPQRVSSTLLSAQDYVPGSDADGFHLSAPQSPQIRCAMARGLAQLLQTTQHNVCPPGIQPWLLAGPDQLWPTPHNILINFQQTATGADWIDAIAQQAQLRLLETPGHLILGHSDWSYQNMAFDGEQLVCVYDWDALRIGQEAWFVGGAARCFNQDWRQGPPQEGITVAEAQAFIHAYEEERGRSFSVAEQRMVGAALVYAAAYGTRCAHQGNQPETLFSQRMKAQLHAFAAHFLD